MHVDAQFAWLAVGAWLALVRVHSAWRSRGDGAPDPIRPSGPLDQV